jgi:hypothetical protein
MLEFETAPAATATVTVLEFVRPVIGTIKLDPEIDGVPTVQFVPVIFAAFATARVPAIAFTVIGNETLANDKGCCIPLVALCPTTGTSGVVL